MRRIAMHWRHAAPGTPSEHRIRVGRCAEPRRARLGVAATGAGAQTFRYASSGDVLALDPHVANESLTNAMKTNIYEGFVHRRWDTRVVPALAESWTQPDATTWRFKLRRGVTFHDGTPFSADDVVFSFKRNKHKNAAMADAVAAVKEVREVDDHTDGLPHRRPCARPAAGPDGPLHHVEEVVRGARLHRAPGRAGRVWMCRNSASGTRPAAQGCWSG
jgi:Bacterial extracellular solute-binding proteins, family 5 Middle